MQDLSDKKQNAIVENLTQIDRDLQKININNSECQVRQLIDCRRQLLADLKSHQPLGEASADQPCHLKYTPPTLVTEQVKKWRSRVMLTKPDQLSFANPQFCNRILRQYSSRNMELCL